MSIAKVKAAIEEIKGFDQTRADELGAKVATFKDTFYDVYLKAQGLGWKAKAIDKFAKEILAEQEQKLSEMLSRDYDEDSEEEQQKILEVETKIAILDKFVESFEVFTTAASSATYDLDVTVHD
jgi:hypothetical protein